MRIVIAVVARPAHLSGVSRHAANMARSLLTRSEISQVDLIVAEWQYKSMCEAVSRNDPRLRIHRVAIGAGSLSRNRWYYRKLPLVAAQLQADVVHLAYPVPLRRSAFHCPVVVTLHDLYPYDIPANFGFPKVLFNRLVLRQCLRAVDAIACVSFTTLRQLDMHNPRFALQKAVMIYNCVECGSRAIVPLPGWRGEPFFLCIAQHRRNKNVALALRVFERLLADREINPSSLLVIIGNDGPETASLYRFIHANGLHRRVVLLQGVSDDQLQWCYGQCEMLWAPSTIEGFGLPIVEAMLRGCKVVCSDILAFREVGGSYCEYFPLQPAAEDAFLAAIRAARAATGFRAAETRQFSCAPIAKAYLSLYSGLLAASSRSDNCGHLDSVPLSVKE